MYIVSLSVYFLESRRGREDTPQPETKNYRYRLMIEKDLL